MNKSDFLQNSISLLSSPGTLGEPNGVMSDWHDATSHSSQR